MESEGSGRPPGLAAANMLGRFALGDRREVQAERGKARPGPGPGDQEPGLAGGGSDPVQPSPLPAGLTLASLSQPLWPWPLHRPHFPPTALLHLLHPSPAPRSPPTPPTGSTPQASELCFLPVVPGITTDGTDDPVTRKTSFQTPASSLRASARVTSCLLHYYTVLEALTEQPEPPSCPPACPLPSAPAPLPVPCPPNSPPGA